MNKKYIQIAKPYIDVSDRKGVDAVLRSGMLSLGPKYREFEHNMAKYAGTKYASAVTNGTCGLHLAVKACGLKKGDEVITSPFSFISSSNCLLYEGVKPVFVDIDETTYNMDPKLIKKAITKKTKAILVVHIFGQPADMSKIISIAKKHRLKIIEDACESLGSKYKGKMAGTFGDIGVYAFYPNKQMTTGEGGIIVSNSHAMISLCNSLRNQGRNTQGSWLIHERIGYNYRMDEMSASLGITQLKKINWMIAKKRKVALWYNELFKSMPHIQIPRVGKNRTHSWFVYVIRITNGTRDKTMQRLQKAGIQTKPYLPVIHLQPFMKKLFHCKKGDFPIAEQIASETLALPLYIGLTKHQISFIADSVIKNSI